MVKSIAFIEDLKPDDIEGLARIFFYKTEHLATGGSLRTISSQWLKDIVAKMTQDNFPTQILRPGVRGLDAGDIIPRIWLALPWTPRKAILCPSHQPLNPFLIRRLFYQIGAECGARISNLAALTRDGVKKPERRALMSPEIRDWVHRMQGVNGLWMRPKTFKHVFPSTKNEHHHNYITGQCEACILSVIGGNEQVISDLRASMISRKKKSQELWEILLWPLVEEWTSWCGNWEDMVIRSEALGDDIRLLRKKLRYERRARREKREQENRVRAYIPDHMNYREERRRPPNDAKGIPQVDGQYDNFEEAEVGEGRGDADEHDFEGSVVDFYQNLLSSTSVHRINANACNTAAVNDDDAIHPAFQDDVTYDNRTGIFHRRGSLTKRSPAPFRNKEHDPRWEPINKPTSPGRPASSIYSRRTSAPETGFQSSQRSDSDSNGVCSHDSVFRGNTPAARAAAAAKRREDAELRRIADKRTEAYRKLVSVPKFDEESPPVSPRQATRKCQGLLRLQSENLWATDTRLSEKAFKGEVSQPQGHERRVSASCSIYQDEPYQGQTHDRLGRPLVKPPSASSVTRDVAHQDTYARDRTMRHLEAFRVTDKE